MSKHKKSRTDRPTAKFLFSSFDFLQLILSKSNKPFSSQGEEFFVEIGPRNISGAMKAKLNKKKVGQWNLRRFLRFLSVCC